jgi:hypothetical protein
MSTETLRPWRSFAFAIQNAADEPPAPAPIIATRGDHGISTLEEEGVERGACEKRLFILNGS